VIAMRVGGFAVRDRFVASILLTGAVAYFACASAAYADQGMWSAFAEWTPGRVMLGVGSVVFAAVLARSHPS
jgi:hypothetical protein